MGATRITLGFLPLVALATLMGCSQAPQPARTTHADPQPSVPKQQILIKALIVETDEAGFQKIFHKNAMAQHIGVTLVDGQVSALLREVARENKLEIISRPYVLATPDQQSQIKIGQETAYIASYKAQPGPAATAYDSQQKTIFSGITLSCTTHVERNDVLTLDVDFSSNYLVRMAKFPAPGIPAERNLSIEEPVNHFRTAQTRVAVKNGETIAIVGRTGEALGVDGKTHVLFLTPHLGYFPAPSPLDQK